VGPPTHQLLKQAVSTFVNYLPCYSYTSYINCRIPNTSFFVPHN